MLIHRSVFTKQFSQNTYRAASMQIVDCYSNCIQYHAHSAWLQSRIWQILRSHILACCYVVAKVYKVCDTIPPCRVNVHMLTIIQFLRARANIHTVLEGQQHVYCIQGNSGLENSYWPIPHFVCSIETLIPRALPSGFMLLYCIQTSGIGQ